MSKWPKAVVIEDEPLARAQLVDLLRELWPELRVEQAANGIEGLHAIELHKAEIAFVDLRLPGLSGGELAGAVADRCHVVFVTAHDDHLSAAFEQGAVDYLLKPVSKERFSKTIDRLRKRVGTAPDAQVQSFLRSLGQGLLPALQQPKPALRWLHAGLRDQMRLVAVSDVVYFEADAKYTRLLGKDFEAHVRLSMKELIGRLDTDEFWQIHRSYVVNVAEIDVVRRLLGAGMCVTLKSRREQLPVSRAFQSRFKMD